MQHLPGRRHGHARILPLRAGLEVDHEVELLDAGGHHVDDALDHVEEVVDLARAGVGVLPPRVEVLARPGLLVEPDNDLLARLLLRRDVVGREGVEAVLAPPGERVAQPLLRLAHRPVGRAEVAQDALAGEPRALVLRHRARLVLVVLGRALDLADGPRAFQQRRVLGLLVGREFWTGLGRALGRGCLEGDFESLCCRRGRFLCFLCCHVGDLPPGVFFVK